MKYKVVLTNPDENMTVGIPDLENLKLDGITTPDKVGASMLFDTKAEAEVYRKMTIVLFRIMGFELDEGAKAEVVTQDFPTMNDSRMAAA